MHRFVMRGLVPRIPSGGIATESAKTTLFHASGDARNKSAHDGKWRGAWLAVLLLLALPAHAVEPSERLPDPAMEARARAISAELRCLVCQNESIDESHADLAHDIRVLVRERLTAGDTDAQAIQAIVSRYGDFVLLRPPVKPATWLLWFGPVALLLIGGIGTLVWLRRRPVEAPAGLSAEEQNALTDLMRDDG